MMALSIEHDPRYPFKKVYFSVVRHPQNTLLTETLDRYQRTVGQTSKFFQFTSLDILRQADMIDDPQVQDWKQWYKKLYNV